MVSKFQRGILRREGIAVCCTQKAADWVRKYTSHDLITSIDGGLHFSVHALPDGALYASGVPELVTVEALRGRRSPRFGLCHPPTSNRVVLRRSERDVLADHFTTDDHFPTRSLLLTSAAQSVRQIACGVSHCVVLAQHETGALQLFSWGVGHHGQLGLGAECHISTTMAPIDTSDLLLRALEAYALQPNAFRLRCGPLSSALALIADESSTLWLWGLVPALEGAQPAFVLQHRPSSEILSPCDFRIADVAVGLAHVVLLSDQGTVFTWGHNDVGQLGIGLQHPQARGCVGPMPYPVDLRGVGVRAVACGYEHTVALADDGSQLFAWGSNRFGACGAATKFLQYPHPVVVDMQPAQQEGQVVGISCKAHTSVVTSVVTVSDSCVAQLRMKMWGVTSRHHAMLCPTDVAIVAENGANSIFLAAAAGYGQLVCIVEASREHPPPAHSCDAAEPTQREVLNYAHRDSRVVHPIAHASTQFKPASDEENQRKVRVSTDRPHRTIPSAGVKLHASPTNLCVPQNALEFLVASSQSQLVLQSLPSRHNGRLDLQLWRNERGDPFYAVDASSNVAQMYTSSGEPTRATQLDRLQREVHAFLWSLADTQRLSHRALFSLLGPVFDAETFQRRLCTLGFRSVTAQRELWFSLYTMLERIADDDPRNSTSSAGVTLHGLRLFLVDPFHAGFWRRYVGDWREAAAAAQRRQRCHIGHLLVQAIGEDTRDPLPWSEFLEGIKRLHSMVQYSMDDVELARLLYLYDTEGTGFISADRFVNTLIRVASKDACGEHPDKGFSVKKWRRRPPDVDSFSTPRAVRKLHLARSLGDFIAPDALEEDVQTKNGTEQQAAELLRFGNSCLARIRNLPVSRLLR